LGGCCIIFSICRRRHFQDVDSNDCCAVYKLYLCVKPASCSCILTGKLHADRNVDLLVEFEPQQKSYDNIMDLSFFLEDLLGRRVEVVTAQSLSKYIGPHILNQAENVSF
jgi:hypothetical protein